MDNLQRTRGRGTRLRKVRRHPSVPQRHQRGDLPHPAHDTEGPRQRLPFLREELQEDAERYGPVKVSGPWTRNSDYLSKFSGKIGITLTSTWVEPMRYPEDQDSVDAVMQYAVSDPLRDHNHGDNKATPPLRDQASFSFPDRPLGSSYLLQ